MYFGGSIALGPVSGDVAVDLGVLRVLVVVVEVVFVTIELVA